jgi:transposase
VRTWLRELKRRLSDIVYHQKTIDARATGPDLGGHSGTTLQSSLTGPTPAAGSSYKPLPGLLANSLKPCPCPRLDTEGSP